VLGTWVGTVLAFYVARDNLHAATDSTVRLAGGIAPTTPVTAVMIGVNQINPKVVVADEAAAKSLKPAVTNTSFRSAFARRRQREGSGPRVADEQRPGPRELRLEEPESTETFVTQP
jgi:hypothetical protein